MIRWTLIVAAVMMTAAPAAAQDYTGNVDPSAYSGPNVMHSAINAQAKRARSSPRSSEVEARRTCANVPNAKKRLGSRDPRVMDLERMCRQAGYL